MKRLIKAQRTTPTNTSFGSAATEDQAELVLSATYRLRVATMLIAGSFALYLVLYNVVWAEHKSMFAQVLSSIIVADSIGFFLYLGRTSKTADGIIKMGLAWQVVVCLGVALQEHWLLRAEGPVGLISWTCAVILIFPHLVVASPRRTLLASLASAAMTPAAIVIAHAAQGDPYPSFDATLSLCLPPVLCALMAIVPARILARMGADVARAKRLGSYVLEEKLGAGGMGEVWRARHRLLVRPAAIKLIKSEVLEASARDTKSVVERFEREAQATAALKSPHTVQLYDYGRSDDGVFYYVMELLSGLDLERFVNRFGPMPPARVVHVLLQACDSLEDAHLAGLVHRDIKPANIYVGQLGQRYDYVKVLDFGLVKFRLATDDGVSATQTSGGRLQGTPAYLAPEMVTGDKVDHRADLYALGCVAYWLLTGRLVFEAESAMKVAIMHATEAPEPPSARAEQSIPTELEEIVMACLQKQPMERPVSAGELARRLEPLAAVEPWTNARAEQWWKDHAPEILEPERPSHLIESLASGSVAARSAAE